MIFENNKITKKEVKKRAGAIVMAAGGFYLVAPFRDKVTELLPNVEPIIVGVGIIAVGLWLFEI